MVEVATSSTLKPVEVRSVICTLPASMIGAAGAMVTDDDAAVWLPMVSVMPMLPATVPGSNVGKATLVVLAGMVRVEDADLVPVLDTNPASPR